MGQPPPSLSEEGDWHLLEYVPDDSFSKYVIRFDVHFPQFCQFFQVCNPLHDVFRGGRRAKGVKKRGSIMLIPKAPGHILADARAECEEGQTSAQII